MGVGLSNRRAEVSLAVLCLVLVAGAVQAQTAPIRPSAGASLAAQARSHDLSAYAAANLHPTVPSPRLTAEIMAALAAPDASPAAVSGTYAAGTAAPAVTPAAPAGSDAPAITGDTRAATSVLDIGPSGRLAGVASGMSAGMSLPLPDDDALSRDTASAIARAFRAAPGTADQAAADAADTATTGDPLLDERIALARTVFKVDGTDELVRHFVATQMMKIVIVEVAKYIQIGKLSDSDKYRLSAVAAAAETELEEKVLNLDARVEATYLSKQDLTLLIVAYDNDAERKQTRLRLADNGQTDRDGALDINMAQIEIVKAFESGK